MKIVAMINRSAGNETVGDMWTETKIFEKSETLEDVYTWASKKYNSMPFKDASYRFNIKLSIAQ